MTIGHVVDLLKNDYPSISISKIRYLESEGLLRPTRTKGGYRTFSEVDVERLKTILALQTDHYLPLQVIKKRLKNQPVTVKTAEKVSVLEDSAEEQAVYSFVELSKMIGVPIAKLEEMQKYGLIKEIVINGEDIFSGADLKIADQAKKLEKFGIGARHLRVYVSAADRQATIYRQIFGPKLNRSSSSAKVRESINELRNIIGELEDLMLDREINQMLH